jgi:hypothetical protein
MLLPDLDMILAGGMGTRVAVVGDLMLDRSIWGRVERIIPDSDSDVDIDIDIDIDSRSLVVVREDPIAIRSVP